MRQSGFTTLEMIIVVVIIGAITMMAFPRIRDGIEKQNFRSARLTIGGWVSATRAAAVARGCRSSIHFVSGGNSRLWVTTCPAQLGAAGRDTIIGPVFTEDRWNVRLQSGRDSITFRPSGLRLTFTPTTILLRTKADETKDSVVVNELGKVVRQ